jgi:hypothetical protein
MEIRELRSRPYLLHRCGAMLEYNLNALDQFVRELPDRPHEVFYLDAAPPERFR